jgi:hypothetical protein
MMETTNMDQQNDGIPKSEVHVGRDAGIEENNVIAPTEIEGLKVLAFYEVSESLRCNKDYPCSGDSQIPKYIAVTEVFHCFFVRSENVLVWGSWNLGHWLCNPVYADRVLWRILAARIMALTKNVEVLTAANMALVAKSTMYLDALQKIKAYTHDSRIRGLIQEVTIGEGK